MKIYSVLALSLLLLSGTTICAAPRVAADTADIKFDRNAGGSTAWKHIYAVNVIYPQLPFSIKAGGILNDLQKEYAGKKVQFFAIVPLPENLLKSFAANHPEFDFTLCADPELKTLRQMLGSGNTINPANIFNYSGKLLWSGDSIDLPMMLKIITSGRYSERNEIRMSALSSSLQAALRSGNARLISESADKILNLRPEQLSAVNAKAYALETSGDLAALEKFFRSRIQRFPQAEENYFMLMDIAYRQAPLAALAPEIALAYIKKFPRQGENINSIAWSLLNNQPYSAEAFTAAQAAIAQLNKLPEFAQKSRVLTTRALLAYRQCNLKLAQKLAAQALQKATAPADKAMLENLLKYFAKIAQ